MTVKISARAAVAVVLALSTVPGATAAAFAPAATSTAAAPAVRAPARTPVVLFPAFHLTRLRVTVRGQHTDRACPRSGTFEDGYRTPSGGPFSQVCQDELLTLRYDADGAEPMARRFAEQPGVRVEIADYGSTASAPFYRTMYRTLESAGYTADRDIKVAGYDARLTPDMGGFLGRTKDLVERTYRANGNRPVQLVGHSNGPLYAQYLLTHTSRAWRDRYVHGFTPIAGNFPGQGSLYSVLFIGMNTRDMGYPTTRANAVSSARMYRTAPSTYMSAAGPEVFGRRETVVADRSTGRRYTPADWPRLLDDARFGALRAIARHYIGFVRFAGPRDFPGTDVHAERGSGLPTMVGARLRSLAMGQVVGAADFLNRDGDGNQEDITNTAVGVWSAMRHHRFTLTDNPGVGHFALPGDRRVLARLLAALGAPGTVGPRRS